ncbi:hypothetical protein Aph01nite_22500 [Acrocarpospora phusangensis]|uniref:Uncharacterized protein n=1 Tax=Acrocarpospora phusangensis TaxID=1070424 RepID=A0A919QAT8_9ACTN|nr:hypothetical protein [Acrocarpospora phusangensis]GIH23940.1 hypothetical protein Aph01nite_22500 [Acrocarpospora phusangensis]
MENVDVLSAPFLQLARILTVERILARSPGITITLPLMRVYRDSVVVELEIAQNSALLSGQANAAASDLFRNHSIIPDGGLKIAIRFADGVVDPTQETEGSTRLSYTWMPRSSSGYASIRTYEAAFAIHPLPPPEKFEILVEWSEVGIDVTATGLDGSAISAKAQQVDDLW